MSSDPTQEKSGMRTRVTRNSAPLQVQPVFQYEWIHQDVHEDLFSVFLERIDL